MYIKNYSEKYFKRKLIYSYIIICELKVSGGDLFIFYGKCYFTFLHIIVSLKNYVAYKKKMEIYKNWLMLLSIYLFKI
ncbi:hypothetical protein EXP44_03465 [Salmonella enterica subsp. enterica serovar Weltevreden]|uniref:Uncharacterized protein n=1 Tax=Salmonella enterica subsp. enterica serovar Weltevreden TaxID=57743 RepID=A0A6D2B753_SALET|nr:hypothetical protein [Salmonella enterica]ECB6839047.1 hypothetical protein [Salmonella enterica subsp. enterica serovar Weltevreden]ECF1676976.1 hypothetical protein [Salmonella enterica subsp. enterica]EAO0789603.1 hypothetical protein [Salmonella enterica]EAO1333410.1 hypothetical protein [Salmonella enterica]